MIRKLLDALTLRRRFRRDRLRLRPDAQAAPSIPPPLVVDRTEAGSEPSDRPRFDLAAAIKELDTPAAWGMLGPESPQKVRVAWNEIFETDCVPLACPHLHGIIGPGGRTEPMVNVHLDAFAPEAVDRIVGLVTRGFDSLMAAAVEHQIRRTGVLPISATGVVIAPTEAEARALAGQAGAN